MPVIRNVLVVSLLLAAVEAFAEPMLPSDGQHPGDAALMQDDNGIWVYRSFPGGARLFVFEKDPPGQSTCNLGCESAWLPLYVSEESSGKQVGLWTILVRDDGTKQWAYKGQPIYRRYHDLPGETETDGFHVLKP